MVAESSDAGGGEPAVVVRDLSKTYGSGETAVRAVDGVDFQVERGEVVGLLGPNGAGKTTTIKSVLGLVIPDEGTVRVDGIDVARNPRAAYRHMGAMLEGARNAYWRLTVRENLSFFAALAGHDPRALSDRHDALLERFDLAAKADTPVKELSRGMKGKVSLVSTLARRPSVVFLDEPTLGLDVESSLALRRELRRLAEEEAMTVLLSSHDMDVVESVCDRVVIMRDGEVVADDDVENLLRVFRTRSYEVTVDEPVPATVRERLRTRFEAGDFERHGDRERFTAAVDGDGFYDLVDTLRAADLPVLAVDTADPDLEEVFLRVTGVGDRDHSTTAGRAPTAGASPAREDGAGATTDGDRS